LGFLLKLLLVFEKIVIITLAFEKNANFFAENWQKSQIIVIITSTPGANPTIVSLVQLSVTWSQSYDREFGTIALYLVPILRSGVWYNCHLPGANPMYDLSFNTSAVNLYNASDSLVRYLEPTINTSVFSTTMPAL
jgi:hypothetical protein